MTFKFWKREKDPRDLNPIIIKVKVKTPKGQATKTAKRIQDWILGRKKHAKENRVINKDDSIIIWTIKTTTIKAMKINRNITFYEQMVEKIWTNKLFLKGLKKKYSKEQLKEVKTMLTDQTTVTILKEGEKLWE